MSVLIKGMDMPESCSQCMFSFGLGGGDWFPKFTNAYDLRKKSEEQTWETTPVDRIEGRAAKEAYADMPVALVEYIRSMPEYDENIFNKITGGAFADDAKV